jgi:hypothetical protein
MLARRLEEAARPLARQASQLALGTAFDSWPTRRTAINPREKNNNQLFVRRTLTRCSPASAGHPAEKMLDRRRACQPITWQPSRACPVQLLVIPRPVPPRAGSTGSLCDYFRSAIQARPTRSDVVSPRANTLARRAAERPDRWRFRPATSIQPTRSAGSPTKRAELEPREENNQSVLSCLRYNAEFTGKRRPSRR